MLSSLRGIESKAMGEFEVLAVAAESVVAVMGFAEAGTMAVVEEQSDAASKNPGLESRRSVPETPNAPLSLVLDPLHSQASKHFHKQHLPHQRISARLG